MDEEQKEELKQEKPEMIDVRIVRQGEKHTVVQWMDDGEPFRVVLLNSKMKDGRVKKDDLDKGQPFGLDFKDVFKGFELPTMKDLELKFKAHNVWTAEDVRKNPQQVVSALGSIYSPILRHLMNYIKAKKL